MNSEFDVGVVGAGILGLAHAYHLAKRGLRVIVFERHTRAQGASIRNFGMVWPIGQPAGPLAKLAERSRDTWLEVLRGSGLWHDPCGSLHLAYHEDEAAVLREFAAECEETGRACELWSANQAQRRFPAIRGDGLRAGLWSPGEVTVDARQFIGELPDWLARSFGVHFAFGATVQSWESPRILTSNGEYSAQRLVICTGVDFRELAPEAYAANRLIPCKLQMMRSQPFGERFRIGTMLAGGLTLRHYHGFAKCPTLPALIRRFDSEMPEYGRCGIHVLVSQNGLGEVIIGDSHEYGGDIDPFDKPRIDELILAYLRHFLIIPDLKIEARWHGIYLKHPTEPYVVARPDANTVAVTAVGGAGMTLSFGLAEQTLAPWFGENS